MSCVSLGGIGRRGVHAVSLLRVCLPVSLVANHLVIGHEYYLCQWCLGVSVESALINLYLLECKCLPCVSVMPLKLAEEPIHN